MRLISNLRLFGLCLCLLFSTQLWGQLVVNTAVSNNALAQSLVGSGVIITNVSVTCPTGAYGAFNGVNVPTLGIDSGLLLTSGVAIGALGPNDSQGFTGLHGNGGATDPQLEAIVAPDPVYDACIFEFDIEPLGDFIEFNFVFASEEYPEYTCSEYNDVFGFFISGPNPLGGNYVNKNIAVIPGTGIPVAINSVNQGSPGANGSNVYCTSTAYSANYYDNGDAITCSFPFGQEPHCSDPNILQYDGFTRNLFARDSVVPCQTYHLKLAVADVGDTVYDSGVFIERINSNREVMVSASTNGGNLNAIEGCNDGNIRLIKTPVENAPVTFNLQVSGTAVNGTDYQPIPTSVTFPAGDTLIDIPIVTISDGITEPLEIINVYILSQCSSTPFDSVLLFILDELPVDIADDTVYSCPNTPVQLTATGGVIYSWSPTTGLSNPNAATTIATIANTTTYTVTGSFAGCTATDDVTVVISNSPQVNVTPDTTICSGGSVTLTATGGVTYSWSPITGLSDPNIANPVASPTATTTYMVTATDNCGNGSSASVQVTVVPFANAFISGLAATYCPGDPPAALTGTPPGGTFSGPGISGNTFNPAAAGIGGPYTISYSVAGGGCSVTVDTTTTVANGPIVSFTGLLDQYCEGDGASLLTLSPSGGMLTGPGIVGNNFDPSAAGVGGPYEIIYTVTTPSGCSGTYRDTTEVNPLPIVSIDGLMPVYCLSDPAENLMLSPSGGSLTGPGTSSSTFTPSVAGVGGPYTLSYTYQDGATGCSNSMDTTVTVQSGIVANVSGYSATYCEDEPAATLTFSPLGGVVNGNGIVGNTFDPAVAGPGVHGFTYTVPDSNGCDGYYTDTIIVFATPAPLLDPGSDQTLCEGDSLTISAGSFAGYMWANGETGSTITVSDSGLFWVDVVSDDGCMGSSDTISVSVVTTPMVTAEPDTLIYLGGSIMLNATTNLTGNVNLTWSPPADLDCTNCPNPTATPLFTTDYTVFADVNGCVGPPDTATIIVAERPFFVPSGFTPNGDGANDLFTVIENGAVELIEFKIFNRWGELVHDDINRAWDGTFREEPQPMGAYTYYAIVVDLRGEQQLLSGSITLIR